MDGSFSPTALKPRFAKNDIMSLNADHPRYHLAESFGPNLRLGDLMDAELSEIELGYGPTAGEAALREAVASRHGVTADDVVITVGAMHALFLIAFALLSEKGDEAVTTAPLFPMARSSLEAVGACVRVAPLSFERGYQLSLADIQPLLSEKTRLVSLASPQNPSGVAIPLDTIGEILAAMQAICPDAYLLIDETYREAVYGDMPVTGSALALGPKVISTASLSKCHGAPGVRLGWAITRDPALREQLLLGKFNTIISCSRVDEALALKVLRQSEDRAGGRRAHLAAGLARTADWALANARFIDWVRPDAGALCCVRLKPEAFDDAAVAGFYEAVKGEDIKLAHGAWFGDETRVFRLGFGFMSLADLGSALDILTRVLQPTANHDA